MPSASEATASMTMAYAVMAFGILATGLATRRDPESGVVAPGRQGSWGVVDSGSFYRGDHHMGPVPEVARDPTVNGRSVVDRPRLGVDRSGGCRIREGAAPAPPTKPGTLVALTAGVAQHVLLLWQRRTTAALPPTDYWMDPLRWSSGTSSLAGSSALILEARSTSRASSVA